MTSFEVRCRAGNQDPDELQRFLGWVKEAGVKRYLEIGCRNGDSFFAVMKAIGPGGVGVAIDLPENMNSRANLDSTVHELRDAGISARAYFGDSRSPHAIEAARQGAPYDLILIDGDHTFNGVATDWKNYADLGRVVALHDVTAPDGFESDGKPNGVGTFWRDVVGAHDETERIEIATPGSNMGFGIALNPKTVKEFKNPGPIIIAVPAWTPPYVDLAVKYTIPAALASLAKSPFRDVTFLMHTDDPARMAEAVGTSAKVDVRQINPHGDGDHAWRLFKQAHKDALAMTPIGGVACLLNSDIVVSKETFAIVADELEHKKVVVSVGIRTAIDHASPPIGVSAGELFEWIWANPHHITRECIWGKGKTHHPTILFFESDEGVAMHCFHLTPMFIRKDRDLHFLGTIDDDLLASYKDDDIHFMTDGAAAFAELSPDWKTHPVQWPLSVDGVLNFGERRFSPAHLRNFSQRMRVLGNPTKNHPAVDDILERFGVCAS